MTTNAIEGTSCARRSDACSWTPMRPDDAMYETSCGYAWMFLEGGPRSNGMRYCPFCGAELAPDPTDEDDEGV